MKPNGRDDKDGTGRSPKARRRIAPTRARATKIMRRGKLARTKTEGHAVTHNVRLATSGDLIAVEAIVQSAYSHYVERIHRQPGPMLDDYRSLIMDGRVYVIEMQARVSGILVLIPQDSEMLLDNIAVAPEAQGHGLGRKLLEFAERQALDAGFNRLCLYTNEAMTENIALYLRIGYVETHRAEEFGLRRIYMKKQLNIEGC
ncbi:MAG: GNAT family N-acetyltransferase [Burkholderiaceae bacterium]